MPGVADDLEEPATDQRIWSHAYDYQGGRVTCLLSEREPFEELCPCGHLVVAATPGAARRLLADHVEWAEKAALHA